MPACLPCLPCMPACLPCLPCMPACLPCLPACLPRPSPGTPVPVLVRCRVRARPCPSRLAPMIMSTLALWFPPLPASLPSCSVPICPPCRQARRSMLICLPSRQARRSAPIRQPSCSMLISPPSRQARRSTPIRSPAAEVRGRKQPSRSPVILTGDHQQGPSPLLHASAEGPPGRQQRDPYIAVWTPPLSSRTSPAGRRSRQHSMVRGPGPPPWPP